MKKLKQILLSHLEDIFIFCGLFLIVVTTFIVNVIVALYTLGGVLLILGIFLSKYPLKKVR
ncbi:hypothetical protein BJL90_14230 [Clostridium formicaceticum]|uniref:Uncharacterized protein n=1 Tax=Clostridium formicaceticum TaxID=1497 RepID=A0ABM6EV34_9CLOT|nr:hypothetical protein BJL90_14230 [Clostridium formicaceticum]